MWIKQQKFILLGAEGWEYKIKGKQNGIFKTFFSLRAFFWDLVSLQECVCVWIFPFCEDISHIDSGLNQIDLF